MLKVIAFTIDNATSGDTFCRYLIEGDHLNNGSIESDAHIRCFAHSLNLCVQRVYDEMNSSIEKIREIVKSINRSSIKKEMFKELLEKKR